MPGFSIDDIIDKNTNKESPKPIPPVVEYYPNFILIKSEHYQQLKKKIIIFTGPTSSRDRVPYIKDYNLIKKYDNGNIEIYSIESDKELFGNYECEILQTIGYENPTNKGWCSISGGKRNRRKTKKNKKRKSKKSKRRRRSKN
jgi:hypothetical protein